MESKIKGKGKVKVLGITPLNERSRYQERFYNRGSGGWLALAIVSRRKVAASPDRPTRVIDYEPAVMLPAGILHPISHARPVIHVPNYMDHYA